MSAAQEHEARAVRLIGDIDGTTPVGSASLLVGAAIASALLAVSARLGEANDGMRLVRRTLVEIRDGAKGGHEWIDE